MNTEHPFPYTHLYHGEVEWSEVSLCDTIFSNDLSSIHRDAHNQCSCGSNLWLWQEVTGQYPNKCTVCFDCFQIVHCLDNSSGFFETVGKPLGSLDSDILRAAWNVGDFNVRTKILTGTKSNNL